MVPFTLAQAAAASRFRDAAASRGHRAYDDAGHHHHQAVALGSRFSGTTIMKLTTLLFVVCLSPSLALADDATVPLDERHQHVEGASAQLDRLSVGVQHALGRPQLEAVEAIAGRGRGCGDFAHGGFRRRRRVKRSAAGHGTPVLPCASFTRFRGRGNDLKGPSAGRCPRRSRHGYSEGERHAHA
jgi:hypothetical protein